MTADSTTIKVPRELRDRIAERAQAEHVTLAKAISLALDLADEQKFWSAVTAGNAALTDTERAQRRDDGTLTDNLADADDDALTATDAW
jgi:hypothetical protein